LELSNMAHIYIAIVLGSSTLRHYLLNYARPLIYTTFLSNPALALIRSSYSLLRSGKTVARQQQLRNLTQSLYDILVNSNASTPVLQQVLKMPNACPKSPIFSIQLDRPKDLAKYLQDHSMMVRAVVPPTVPLGTQRIRVCLHAGNTMADIEKLVQALLDWCEANRCTRLIQSRL
jgi:8-amino-7-oxononanoate synthase